MTQNPEHEEMKDLIAAYVLGSVPAEEVPRVRSHILTCEECMREADSYSEVAGSLGLATGEEPLPPGFADKVLAQARSEAPGPVDELEAARRKRRWTGRFKAPSLISAAAVLAAFALVTGSLVQTRSKLRERDQVLTALIHSKGAADLQGDVGATGKLVPTSEGAYLLVAGLGEPPAGHTYQLWLLHGTSPTSAGTFDPDDGVAIITTNLDTASFDAAAVTIEPQGGSPEPTTDPILSGSLSA